MIEANKLKLGLFIVISMTVVIGSLIALGLIEEFKEKNEIYTIFDESVQGLEEGAPIKYKGVTIGRVSKISILQKRYIKVDMETDPDSVIGENLTNKKQSRSEQIREFNEYIQDEVRKGLRCSLEISSIATGLKFIELTHINPEKKEEVTVSVGNTEDEKFIPAMKSLLSGAITNFDKTLSNVAKIDYEGIGEEAKLALINLNKILTNPHIQSLLQKSDTAASEIIIAAKNLNTQLKSIKLAELQNNISTLTTNTDKNIKGFLNNTNESINGLTTRLDKSLTNLDSLIVSIDKEMKALKLAETAEAARTALNKTTGSITAVEKDTIAALKSAKQFMDSLSQIKKDISQTLKSVSGASNSLSGMRGDIAAILKRFKVTLDSVSSFVDYLEKDPAALIHGKSKKK